MATERKWYLDILRILSIFLVIIIHVCAPHIVNYNGSFDYSYIMLILFDSLSRCSVPLFVMVSGALLLNKKKETSYRDLFSSKILCLVTSLLFFSFFYITVGNLFLGHGFNLAKIIRAILMGYKESHLWFLYMIIGLYIISPLLKILVDHLKKKDVHYFFLVSLFFCSLLPMVLSFTKLNKFAIFKNFDLGFFSIYIVYFLLGYYLSNKEFNQKEKKLMSLTGLISLFITFIMTILLTWKRGYFSSVFFEYSSINVIFYSIFIFVKVKDLFKDFKPSVKTKTILTTISSLIFGVYLFHMFFSNLFIVYMDTFVNRWLLKLPICTTLVFSLFVFMISLIVSYFFSKIPVINKYLIYYDSKKKRERKYNR